MATERAAAIIGWAHTPFGKRDDADVEDLIGEVAADAIAHAGLEPADVDRVVLGHFNAGFSPQDFTASLVLQHLPDLRFRPITRFENACATGTAAIHGGLDAIAAGRARCVLVVGVEKMTGVSGREIGDILLRASYKKEEADIEGGFAGVFARIADLYFQKHGDRSDALAAIAAKNHANGAANPLAHFRGKAFDLEFCRAESDKNPRVAGPLKRTDCSPVTDGAAALVLADADLAAAAPCAVAFRAAVQVNDFLPMSKRDVTLFEGPARAWAQAYEAAGVGLDDLDLVETHDCFTIAELLEYEAMGLTPAGRGHVAVEEGWTRRDGKLPVNPSGGLKAKGQPIGATGVSMHVMAAMQLTESAGDTQVPGATLAGVFNMGGAAVANYTSILERRR